MSNQKSSKNNFIMQAGILAAAGLISRIIGLLYRSPLTEVVGELGISYYQTAYSFYTIVLLVSSYSIPSAISKVIAQKLALREYRNAHRIFLCSLVYVLVVGGAASLFLFFGAGVFVKDEAVPVLRTFAPTIFVYGVLGVLRGYFQAHKTMAQTSVSQILEQIANAAVSIGAAFLLIRYGMGSLDLPADTQGQIDRATYGAIGSALGTGAGVVVALLFMLAIYGMNRGYIHKRIRHDRHGQVDSFGSIIRTITVVVTPFILSTAIYNLNDAVNTSIYTKIYPSLKEVDHVVQDTNWGIFAGIAMTISKIPIAFASAMAAAMLPSIAQQMAAENVDGARRQVGAAVKSTMIISIPSAVGLLVLAEPITYFLFPRSDEVVAQAARFLMVLALSVVFYALSTLNSSILQGLGKVNAPIINAGASLVIQTAVAMGLLFFTNMDLYSIAIANTVYSGVMCILNQWSVRKAIGYRQEILGTFCLPALSSLFMGAAAWAVYEGLHTLTRSVRLSLIPALVVAVVVYFAMLLMTRALTEQELRGFPKGHLLVKVAKKCRLLR